MPIKKLSWSLFILRCSVFLVIFMWILDKFIHPEHAAQIFAQFSWLTNLNQNINIYIGIVELIIIVGFLFGIKKTFTYGYVLIFYAVSVLSSYPQYFNPYTGINLLFFPALPMLAACFALFLLRQYDTLFILGKKPVLNNQILSY